MGTGECMRWEDLECPFCSETKPLLRDILHHINNHSAEFNMGGKFFIGVHGSKCSVCGGRCEWSFADEEKHLMAHHTPDEINRYFTLIAMGRAE